MVGSGLKKLAAENGMKVSAGVAYGDFRGYAVSFWEGAGFKAMAISTKFTDVTALNALQAQINGRNVAKEFRVQQLNFAPNGVFVQFLDNPGTMKKMTAFFDWFFPLLGESSATGVDICPECGCAIETDSAWTLVDGVAFHQHRACAEAMCRGIDQEYDRTQEEDTGSYGGGFVGALLGGVLGGVVWGIVLLLGYVASIVGLLIAWLADKGYTLCRGKRGKGKVAILIVAILVGLLVGTFGADAFMLAQMISAGEIPGAVYGDIPFMFLLLFTDSAYVTATLGNLALGVLFAGLGVWAFLRKANKEVSKARVITLE